MDPNDDQHAPAGSEQGSSSVRSTVNKPTTNVSFKDPAAGTSKTKDPIGPPTRLPTTTVLPELAPADALAIGNKEYETMLMIEHRVGIFYKRTNTENFSKWVTLNADNFRTSILHTLKGALSRCLYMKGLESDVNVEARVERVAELLRDGVCVATYNRLRAVNFGLIDEGDRYILKPKAPNPLEIPKAFATAIQLLGAIEIPSLTRKTIAFPTISADEAARFLLPAGRRFKPAEYAKAVEYCKTIGVSFASVDLSLKSGSAWWLFNGQTVDQVFQLTMTLPDSNFTEQDALLHLMFCADENGQFGNPLFELGELNVADHGSLLRNPHDDANVNSFFAYSDEPLSQLWKIEG